MKKASSSNRKHWYILPLSLLAILCIGAAELTACYFFDPALYERVTAPARHCAEAAAEVGKRAALAASEAAEQAHLRVARQVTAASVHLSAFWTSLTDPKEELPEQDRQLAEDPVLTDSGASIDPAVTELTVIDGREVLTGGTIPVVYYNQSSDTWADQPYGTDDIGHYGCGPTAMSMVICSMTEEQPTPLEMARWAVSHGHWAKRGGSYLSLVEGAAGAYGLTAVSLPEHTVESVQDALLSGKLLVALMGPGHFTKSGHFIVLRGITLSGRILVADPNSEERSLEEWEPELILEELSSSTANGAPLWAVSQGEPPL